jgi:pimeloyl-ACP methyl ester carboxylesterase
MHLVLLPGMDGTGELFAPLIEALPESVEVSIVSYPRDECLSWEDLYARVQQAVPVGEPLILVAESFSGPLAIMLASNESLDIQGLVLCCSFASCPLPNWFRFVPVLGSMMAFMPKFIVRRFLIGPNASSELMSTVQNCVKSVSPRVLASRAKMILKANVLKELQNVHVPLLYLAGSQDRVIAMRGWNQVQSLLPKSTLVTLDGPHLLLQQMPDASVNEIMKFAEAEDNQPLQTDHATRGC